ncbi:MAG: hypothetical protein ACM3YE_06095 [Bacteroidota bacterium]
MKKLLVVLMAAVMVLSMAAVSMAAVTVSGDATFTKDFDKDLDKDATNSDKYDINIFFKNQINDTVDWTLRFNAAEKWADDAETVNVPWTREAYANVKLGEGKLTFGMWEVKPYTSIGILADNADSAIGRLKAPLTVGYTSPELFPGFKAGLVYFIDGNKVAKEYDTAHSFEDGAYVLSLSYKAGMVAADLFYVDLALDNQEAGYALNAKVNPVDGLTLGLNYGERPGAKNAQTEVMIVEAEYEVNKFYVGYAMDLEDGKNSLRPDDARTAYRFGYTFANGIGVEYRSKDKDVKAAGKMEPSQELRIKVKF